MGRRSQPAAVKEAKGNPGRRRIARGAAQADGAIAEPKASAGKLPDWIDTRKRVRTKDGKVRAHRISTLAERIWNFAHPELVRLNLVKSLDEIALGIYCRAVAEYVDCTDTIDREGASYVTSSAHVADIRRPHPAVRQRKEAYQVIKEQGEVLGMNPAARQRLFQALLNRAGQLPLPGHEGAPAQPADGGLFPPDGTATGIATTSPIGLLN